MNRVRQVQLERLPVLEQSIGDGCQDFAGPAVNLAGTDTIFAGKPLPSPEFEEYITERINNEWIGKVNELKTRLLRGKEIAEQINILGDDGVPVEYHVIFWKSELIDFVILQQDAFDEVDSVTPMERQEEIVNQIIDICHTDFEFDNFVEVMDYFKKMINICKQMNYSKFRSEQYVEFQKQLKDLVAERSVK